MNSVSQVLEICHAHRAEMIPEHIEARSLWSHAKSRDSLGFPILNRCSRKGVPADDRRQWIMTWNADHQQLRNCVQGPLRAVFEQHRFVTTWFQKYLKIVIDEVPRDVRQETSVNDEIESLISRQERAHRLLRLYNEFLDFRVADISDVFSPAIFSNPFLEPNTLARFWVKGSHTRYSDELGFQCSDWRNILPVSFEELERSKTDSLRSVRTHLTERKASRWISLTDDLAWVLKHARKWGADDPNSECQVAIISVPKLDRLEILWQRSDVLVDRFGRDRREGGFADIEFTWPHHFLVYGWIPPQCVIQILPFAYFQKTCAEKGIKREFLRAFVIAKIDKVSWVHTSPPTKASFELAPAVAKRDDTVT